MSLRFHGLDVVAQANRENAIAAARPVRRLPTPARHAAALIE